MNQCNRKTEQYHHGTKAVKNIPHWEEASERKRWTQSIKNSEYVLMKTPPDRHRQTLVPCSEARCSKQEHGKRNKVNKCIILAPWGDASAGSRARPSVTDKHCHSVPSKKASHVKTHRPSISEASVCVLVCGKACECTCPQVVARPSMLRGKCIMRWELSNTALGVITACRCWKVSVGQNLDDKYIRYTGEGTLMFLHSLMYRLHVSVCVCVCTCVGQVQMRFCCSLQDDKNYTAPPMAIPTLLSSGYKVLNSWKSGLSLFR